MAAPKPDLGLMAEIVTAGGSRFQWGPGARYPGDVPLSIGFATRLGDGFGDGGCILRRPIDRNYPDVNLLDDFNLIGVDGSVAYEGRVTANPRSVDSSGHSITISAAGHMAITRDRKMQIIFVDRDFGSWSGASTQRRINLNTLGFNSSPSFSTAPDDSGNPALETSVDGAWGVGVKPVSEAWYDARGLSIGGLYWAWMKGASIVLPDANWNWNAALSTDDVATTIDSSGNLASVGPGGFLTNATAENRKYAVIQLYYNAASAGTQGVTYPIWWTVLAVYGNHGLTKRNVSTFTRAQGFYVSDMVRYVVQTVAPQLDVSGIVPMTYVVEHAVYLDPMDPFDILADLNKYCRFIFGAEEGKRFFFRPADLTDYDWQVDYNDPGVEVKLQGDSTDGGVYNGICVNFTNLANGRPGRLTPLDATYGAVLTDSDPTNPATMHSYPRWPEITLSFPALPDAAAQVGRMALAEMNTPKGEGNIIVSGHIKDRAGHWQQGWKPRAGQTVAITSSASLSDRPRLISETQWNHETKTLTITVESIPQMVEAFFDRVDTSLAAANLS